MDGIAEALHDSRQKYIRIDGRTVAGERMVSWNLALLNLF